MNLYNNESSFDFEIIQNLSRIVESIFGRSIANSANFNQADQKKVNSCCCLDAADGKSWGKILEVKKSIDWASSTQKRQDMELMEKLAKSTVNDLDEQLALKEEMLNYELQALEVATDCALVRKDENSLLETTIDNLDRLGKVTGEEAEDANSQAVSIFQPFEEAATKTGTLVKGVMNDFLTGNLKDAKDYWRQFVGIGKNALKSFVTGTFKKLVGFGADSRPAEFGDSTQWASVINALGLGGGTGIGSFEFGGNTGSTVGVGDAISAGKSLFETFSGTDGFLAGVGNSIVGSAFSGAAASAAGLAGGIAPTSLAAFDVALTSTLAPAMTLSAALPGIGAALAVSAFALSKILADDKNPRVQTEFGFTEDGQLEETFRKRNDLSQEDGDQIADSFSTAVTSTINSIGDTFGLVFEEITGKFGAQLIRSKNNGFQVKIGDQHYFGRPGEFETRTIDGGEYGESYTEEVAKEFGKDEAGFVAALKFFTEKFIEEFSSNGEIPETLAKVLANSTATELEDLALDLEIATLFENGFINEPEKIVGPFEAALKNLEESFEAALPEVERLGLSVEEFGDKFDQATAQLRQDFDSRIEQQILGITSPMLAQIDAIQVDMDAALQEAAAVGGNTDQVLELYNLRLQALTGTLGIDEPEKATGPFEQAMQALMDSFAAALPVVEKLGLSVEEFSDKFDQATAQLRQDFNRSVQQQINQYNVPFLGDTMDLISEFDFLMQEAAATGGDALLVTELYMLKLKELTAAQGEAGETAVISASQWESVISQLQGFRSSLLTGSLSTLSPEQKLAETRAAFEDVSRRAQLGDFDAISELPGVAQAFLEASQFYNASSEAYAADFNSVTEILDATESVAERQLAILSAIDSSISEMQSAIVTVLERVIAGQQDMGVNIARNIILAASSGYTGDFGSGGYRDFVYDQTAGQDLGKSPDFNRELAAATGYKGDFGSGGFGEFIKTASELQKEAARQVFYMFGEVPGFNQGGSFTIPGAGVDNVVPLMRVSGGETVSIARRGGSDEIARRLDRLIKQSEQAIEHNAQSYTAIVGVLRATREDNADMRAKLSRVVAAA